MIANDNIENYMRHSPVNNPLLFEMNGKCITVKKGGGNITVMTVPDGKAFVFFLMYNYFKSPVAKFYSLFFLIKIMKGKKWLVTLKIGEGLMVLFCVPPWQNLC